MSKEVPVSLKKINAELRTALIDCHDAMVMQLKREAGEFHITAQTARYMWDNALAKARSVLGDKYTVTEK